MEPVYFVEVNSFTSIMSVRWDVMLNEYYIELVIQMIWNLISKSK